MEPDDQADNYEQRLRRTMPMRVMATVLVGIIYSIGIRHLIYYVQEVLS